MALERRQRRLHARQRRAQLVARVGREAPGRAQCALAVGRRAPQPREHRVEARGQRAQLGRAAVGRHAPLEVLVLGDARGDVAQPLQRAQDERRRPARPPRSRPPAQAAPGPAGGVELRLARLERRQRWRPPPGARARPGPGRATASRRPGSAARPTRTSAARAAAAGAWEAARRCPAAPCPPSVSRSELPVADSTASRRLSLSGSSSLTAAHGGRARQLRGALEAIVERRALGGARRSARR